MGQRGQQTLDVEALVAELRAEAETLRAELGPSDVAPPDDPPRHREDAGADGGSLLLRDLEPNLERLRGLADPRSARVESHRGTVAAPILAAKRLLIRVLTPIWEQQTALGRGIVDQVAEMGAAVRTTSSRLELRLADLDRRLRAIEDAVARDRDSAGSPDAGFDYEEFEARFRGSADEIRERQRRYVRFFADATAGPVLELGCGEGTFLDLLRGRGVVARGVDRSEGAVARARAAGLDVSHGDLVSALEACPDDSLGGVVSIQVVEHLSLPVLLHVLRLAKQKLRPGGIFLAETVNLASLIVHARGWTIDPTHRQALHPLTLEFLVQQAGFSDCERLYAGEVEPETRLEIPSGNGPEARNAARLNDIVFGPQDYAVVGRA